MPEDEASLLGDLRSVGLEIDTVWNLYTVPDVYPRAIPILLKHLALDYPNSILEGIGGALDHKSARASWAELKTLYLETGRVVARDGLAVALSRCATREHYEDLLAFVGNKKLRDSRIFFLRPINRIGNRISPGQGRAVIESLVADPVLGIEATAILQGRSQGQ